MKEIELREMTFEEYSVLTRDPEWVKADLPCFRCGATPAYWQYGDVRFSCPGCIDCADIRSMYEYRMAKVKMKHKGMVTGTIPDLVYVLKCVEVTKDEYSKLLSSGKYYFTRVNPKDKRALLRVYTPAELYLPLFNEQLLLMRAGDVVDTGAAKFECVGWMEEPNMFRLDGTYVSAFNYAYDKYDNEAIDISKMSDYEIEQYYKDYFLDVEKNKRERVTFGMLNKTAYERVQGWSCAGKTFKDRLHVKLLTGIDLDDKADKRSKLFVPKGSESCVIPDDMAKRIIPQLNMSQEELDNVIAYNCGEDVKSRIEDHTGWSVSFKPKYSVKEVDGKFYKANRGRGAIGKLYMGHIPFTESTTYSKATEWIKAHEDELRQKLWNDLARLYGMSSYEDKIRKLKEVEERYAIIGMRSMSGSRAGDIKVYVIDKTELQACKPPTLEILNILKQWS